MGYFAARYGYTIVGALIPSSTSQAAPSAADLAALKSQIAETGAPVVFNEIGTPPALARAIADETGVKVVELATHTLPRDESYETFIDELAAGIAGALGGRT
jgi:zinc/manganese transport system substrate-binding protein